MKKIDLVFRSVEERTSKVALELAKKNINPNKIHFFENVKPFSLAVEKSLQIDYDADFVVFMDADCLILEDIRPYLEENDRPFIDCYVLDKFRGHIHCGVHITRVDLVRAMKAVELSKYDVRYMLRPESRTRHLALKANNWLKHFESFHILHDFEQYYKDIFSKYVLRELRSRKSHSREDLAKRIEEWKANQNDLDYKVALAAINYARENVGDDADFEFTKNLIDNLTEIGKKEIQKLGIKEKEDFSFNDLKELERIEGVKKTEEEVSSMIYINKSIMGKAKIFGIGLSRTGTKSLTKALGILGYDIVHYPNDEITFQEITGNFDSLTILQTYEGITDITAAAIYPQLDKLYPGSKFILTVRPKEDWLNAMERHWKDKPVHSQNGFNHKLEIRKFLRASVYGCYTYNRDRLSFAYDNYISSVKEYFKNEPEKLLIFDIYNGDGFKELCKFLNHPVPDIMYPKVDSKSSLK
ncbi:MAG: hypothetical protein H7A25_16540 [Leptospiraceae bacterium]|nr:hypothetical protein [Leptospiraceae bacterium]MCP5501512.1 hypothetical protein [Leptospiraceae bacterium]